jgi:hypothetical protein
MRKKYMEKRIALILKGLDARMAATELYSKHPISEQTSPMLKILSVTLFERAPIWGR